jgi:putative hydrolase of HD superfamily
MADIGSPHIDEPYSRALFQLLHRIQPLKHLLRTGWIDREVISPETVAAHSWRLAVMAWLVADALELDSAKAIKIALVHDLAEAITGDSTPFDELGSTAEERRALASDPPNISEWRVDAHRETKAASERSALAILLEGAPPQASDALLQTWEVYARDDSPEAQLVHQLDKLEAFLQGCEYAAEGRLADPKTLNSFRTDSESLIKDPLPRALLRALESWYDDLNLSEGQPSARPKPEPER